MYLSIIIPCYNEEKHIAENVERVRSYMTEGKYDFDYEIVLVNDGSKDSTGRILQSLSEEYDEVRAISYDKNGGKGCAVKQGMKVAQGKKLLFMDADLSTDLNAINLFLENIELSDMTIGSRRHPLSVIARPQGKLRKFIGNCCVIIFHLLFGIKIYDTQCGFKGFSKELSELFLEKSTINGWLFDIEFIYIAFLNKKTISEIPVHWKNDENSSVSPISGSISAFREMIKIRTQKDKYFFRK